jgi:hypothetical protein
MVVLLRGETEVATWPLERTTPPDLAAADDLARLQLLANRAGCAIKLRNTCPRLRELLDLVGLSDVLPDAT